VSSSSLPASLEPSPAEKLNGVLLDLPTPTTYTETHSICAVAVSYLSRTFYPFRGEYSVSMA